MTREEKINEEAYQTAYDLSNDWAKDDATWHDVEEAFKRGVEWADKNPVNLWHDAQGDNLPEIGKSVIVLTQPYPLDGSEYAVSFAHRPNPEGWNGKSLLTDKVEHYTPQTYEKGGWNIPDVKWWCDISLPKEGGEE